MPSCPNCDAESEKVWRCEECGKLLDDDDGADSYRSGGGRS